jgi:hypothetical protein
MEVAIGGERRTYETGGTADLPICVWVSSQSNESRVHNQEKDLPRLLGVRTRIRIFLGIDGSGTAPRQFWRTSGASQSFRDQRLVLSLKCRV